MITKNLKKRKMYTTSTLMSHFRSSTAGPLLMIIMLVNAMAAIAEPPVKIHSLGDSTTYGYETECCWRYYMCKKLKENGYNNNDFVGSKNSPTRGKIKEEWDRDHDGHTSQSAHGLLNRDKNNIREWATKFTPHIAVIYLGTNDIRGRRKTEDIIKTLTDIIQVYRDARREVKIVVCQLPYWNWGKGGSKAAVDALNKEIPSLKDLGTEISPIKIVDLNSNYTLNDLRDKIHPGITGAQKIADRVYNAITPWLDEMKYTSVKHKLHVLNQPKRTIVKTSVHLAIRDNMPACILISRGSDSNIHNGQRYLITGRKITAK